MNDVSLSSRKLEERVGKGKKSVRGSMAKGGLGRGGEKKKKISGFNYRGAKTVRAELPVAGIFRLAA